ncbi:MAG: malto-oligosyltrehalose synthase [Candidatus Dormibacteria bacterium]
MTGDVRAAPPLVATYRLQLHAGFDFGAAASIVPYLAELGVSHLYLSPILQAVPGSMHGYDQCDPTRISDELGGDTGFRRLVASTRSHRMGIILDIVPNHMAASDANPWWWELLRSGRDGRTGTYFDVDWNPGDPDLKGRVLLPVLGGPLDGILAAGELKLARRDGYTVVRYYDNAFPIRDASGAVVISAELLESQNYSLASWRDAATRLNYRRFFDINSLVALREEDPAVFAAVHDLPLRMIEEEQVQGLRVDHVDGLRDPGAYLQTLRQQAGGAWLLAEKILEPGEHLPAAWPVDGTTGYDFIHRLQGVFIDPDAEVPMSQVYERFTGEATDYRAVVAQAKKEAAQRLFASDFRRLERIFARVCAGAAPGFTEEARLAALQALAVAFPVYRTYRRPGDPITPADRRHVEAAADAAATMHPRAEGVLIDLLRRVLLGDVAGGDAAELTARFQQLSGPLMAKGVEDTAFYRYNRLVCLNEVGADPGTFGVTTADFHAANLATLEGYPTAMLGSSTHDTKRSEDVRARLSLLAQVPSKWEAAVQRWSRLNARHRSGPLPDRNAEYLLYQTLVGAWPLPEERAVAYMQKAAREAKQHTSWTDPDGEYEEALQDFVRGACRDADFQADVEAFVRPLVDAGRQVALAMTLLKLTSPGVPDLYQGTEAWDLSLVDPDNRRPVDYQIRREMLDRLDQPSPGEIEAGIAKVRLVATALRVRRAAPEAFLHSSRYTPLLATGPAAAHLLAFARGTHLDDRAVVVVVPRLLLGRDLDWEATRLKIGEGGWTDQLAGKAVSGPVIALDELLGGGLPTLLTRDR